MGESFGRRELPIGHGSCMKHERPKHPEAIHVPPCSSMFLDPADFELVRTMETHFEVFRAEAERLTREDYVLWPLRDAYHGEWHVLPLFLISHPDELGPDFNHNRSLCPNSVRALEQHERICSAAFSRLEPGCHIYPHTDHAIEGVLRMHIALITPPGSKIRVADRTETWEEGRGLIFDGRTEHEAANLGSTARTVMLIDFVVTKEEHELAWPGTPYHASVSPIV